MAFRYRRALLLAKRIADDFGLMPGVEAVALGGSTATRRADAGSDIDIYIYSHSDIPFNSRQTIANATGNCLELNNQYWETGDEWLDKGTGIHVDLMYRSVTWIEGEIGRLLKHHQASIGYSTCLLDNIIRSKLLIDKHGWFAKQQAMAKAPYPDQLRRNIVAKNYPLLRDTLSSYRHQISTALERGDRICVNHRVAAWLSSYFDILFAVNRLYHPGEKRIIEFALSQCGELPENLNSLIHRLFDVMPSGDGVLNLLDLLADGLADYLNKRGLLAASPT